MTPSIDTAGVAGSDASDADPTPRGRRVRTHDGSSDDALGAIEDQEPSSPRASRKRAVVRRGVLSLPLGVEVTVSGSRDGVATVSAVSTTSIVDGVAVDRLISLIERIERLEEERKALGQDVKDVYAEAKSAGFDVAVCRDLVRLRKQEPAAIEEHESLLDLYRRALGM